MNFRSLLQPEFTRVKYLLTYFLSNAFGGTLT